MSINFDAHEFDAMAQRASAAPAKLQRALRTASATSLTEGVGLMQGFAPVDQGFLRGSIGIHEGPSITGGAFGTSVIYARIQDQGGTISGNPWLYIQKAGRIVARVASVHIPGSQYKARTLRALRPRVIQHFRNAVKQALGGWL